MWRARISAEAAEWLAERHDGLAIRPLVADFTKTCTLPVVARRPRKLGFFSGSTIGNLTHAEAQAFLVNAARLLGHGAAFLVGVDLKKDPAILIPAYNDQRGVTAAFNLNLLERINRELDGDIDVGRFAHDAIYDESQGRIEMHLVSLARQTVRVLGHEFRFAKGERIHTENSHKYSAAEFQALAKSVGWSPGECLDRPGPALQPASLEARLNQAQSASDPAWLPRHAKRTFQGDAIPVAR